MLPFAQNMAPNQPSSGPPRASTPLHHQQVSGNSPNMFPNPLQMQAQVQSQMGFINPQLSNPFNNNNNMGNVGRPPGFMGMPNFNALQQQQFQPQPGFTPQNFGQNSGFLGNGQLGNMGQFGGWQNQAQNMNQLGGGVMLNQAQVAALSQLLGCVSQVAQGMVPQNTAFLGNPQLGGLQQQQQQQQGNFGQQLPVGSQQLQNVPTMPFAPALTPPRNPSQNLQNQGNHSQNQGIHNANGRHNQNKNFSKTPGRERSNWRSPNSKPQHINKGRKETQSVEAESSADQTKSGKQSRPFVQLYTEKEIQKWREERKKNYPTKDVVQKKQSQKQANADAAAEEAKLRREQLKEVLAKQVELGFEVPEIPSHYLLDDEGLVNKKGRNKRPLNNNGRHQNRFNKRGRFDKTNRFSSNRDIEDDNAHNHIATNPKDENKNHFKAPTKEPTLLEKLLSTDMKRDKNRLLQALRFMVMNSFFKDTTEDSLNFPKVIVEERGDVGNEDSSLKELNDIIESPGGCQEEGEITD